MDPIERAASLKIQADEVLQYLELESVITPYGPIAYTGSYYLDLMVFPDIDLYFPSVSIDDLFKIGSAFANKECVRQVQFHRSMMDDLPGGLYLKPLVNIGNWGRMWKIDIWSVDEGIIQRKMIPMQRYQRQLTPDLREKIIRYKFSILNQELRTPVYSGYFIYKAFMDEGLRDHALVTQYLIRNGISMGEPLNPRD